jgi:hypothetical protein
VTDPNDPSQIGFILSSDVTSAATVSDVVSKVSLLVQAAGQGDVNVTTRTVNGGNLSVIDVSGDGSTPVSIEYGVVDNEFLFGVGNGVDTYIDGPSTSLADSEDYQAALAELPTGYDGVFYVNVPALVALGETASAMSSSSFLDKSDECGTYSTQAAAQEAYDADTVSNYMLDLDFDGQACEDYFAAPAVAASPEAGASSSAVRAFATVSYQEDGLNRTSSILLIGE